MGRNFRHQNKEINFKILIKYARDNVGWNHFRDNLIMKENEIQTLAFVNLILVAQMCSSTTRCGHRTGAVLSSDEHWHPVLEHCFALLESYDSSAAASAATGRSGVGATVLAHCQTLPMTESLLMCKSFTKFGKIWSSAPSTACQCSHPLFY